jgi:hypothetical protein
MAGLDAARLRALADELDAEETAAKRELEDAESKTERERLEATIAELQAKQAELEQRLETNEPPAPPTPDPADEDVDDDEVVKPKTRKGRKNGQVYQDRPGESAYVYQGEDEDDIVVIEADAA